MKKKIMILTIAIILALALAPAQVLACTAVYVGSEVSDDGTTIIARSNDAHPSNVYQTEAVVDRVENKPGRTIKGNCGIVYELPATTFKYTSMAEDTAVDDEIYSAVCLNEYGLGISATVTGYISPEIMEMDPYVEKGLCEDMLPDVIACQCKTAREAVEFYGREIARLGSAESNIFMVADKNEAWYVESYTGHQWAAVKMPEDKVAAYGNQFMLQTIKDRKDKTSFLCSKECFSLPEKSGLAVYRKGKMSLCETYAGEDRLADYANLRTYMGHFKMAPSTAGKYETLKRYPLFYKPDTKIGLDNVFELLRYRFEGTEYSPDETGATNRRVIGTETQQSVHAIQVYHNMPKKMCLVSWECLGNAEHSVFQPISQLVADTAEPYKNSNRPTSKPVYTGIQADENYPMNAAYYPDRAGVCFKRLSALAEQNRQLYGKGVRDYWHLKELKFIKEYPEVLAKAKELYDNSQAKATEYITDYTVKMQKRTLNEANDIYNQLTWYMMGVTDTLKHKFNYGNLILDDKLIEPLPFCPKQMKQFM